MAMGLIGIVFLEFPNVVSKGYNDIGDCPLNLFEEEQET